MSDTIPTWLSDMGDLGAIPVIATEGAERGAISYMNDAQAAAAFKARTHLSAQGRDMSTLDLDAEIAAMHRRTIGRAPPEPKPEPLPDAPLDAPVDAQIDEKAAKPATARVGSYANRAMTTKTNQGK